MDLRKLKKLIDLVEESGIAELEVTEGEEKVRIVKHTMVAAAPQVGGQAMSRVITPGQMAGEFITSSSVSSWRKSAIGLLTAWRLALARTLAKVDSGAPYLRI